MRSTENQISAMNRIMCIISTSFLLAIGTDYIKTEHDLYIDTFFFTKNKETRKRGDSACKIEFKCNCRKYFFCRYEMNYTDTSILAVIITLCLIEKLYCCAVEEVVTCQRENMTCLKSLCTCHNRAWSPNFIYFSAVSCSELTEVPKDIPNEVHLL